MTTTHAAASPSETGTRVPLRLQLSGRPGVDRLDGAWWPQSRDIGVELADLVDHFPTEVGKVVRVVYSPPDWDLRPHHVAVEGRTLKVGSFPHDDTHQVTLRLADHAVLQLLVVPPNSSTEHGEKAMRAASTTGNRHTAADLLNLVSEDEHVDAGGHWRDDGGSWWTAAGTRASGPTD
ncbi:MAG: DUF5994 family protein [Nocardioides sp.]|nr:DUF5994 family protein [Nocardioides sp.]